MLTNKPSMDFYKPLDYIPKLESDLHYISYILYSTQVEKQLVEALIDLSSEINTMNLNFAKKLDL